VEKTAFQHHRNVQSDKRYCHYGSERGWHGWQGGDLENQGQDPFKDATNMQAKVFFLRAEWLPPDICYLLLLTMNMRQCLAVELSEESLQALVTWWPPNHLLSFPITHTTLESVHASVPPQATLTLCFYSFSIGTTAVFR